MTDPKSEQKGVWFDGRTKAGREKWIASYFFNGRQRQKCCPTYAAACRFRLNAEEAKYLGVEPRDDRKRKQPRLTVGAVVARYLKEGCDEDTAERYASLSKRLQAVAGRLPITSLSEVTIRKIREDLKSEGDTRGGKREGKRITEDRITKHIALLRAAARFCGCSAYFDGLRKGDRKRVFKVEHDATHTFRRFTDDEFESIVGELPETFRPGARLAMQTGMRLAEVYGLEEAEVRGNEVHLSAGRTKSRRGRVVILNAEALAQLPNPRGDGGLVFLGRRDGSLEWQASHAWGKAAEAAGLPHIWFHDIRHEWASRFVEKGGSVIELKEAGGWASLAMVQRYATASRDRIRAIQETPYRAVAAEKTIVSLLPGAPNRFAAGAKS